MEIQAAASLTVQVPAGPSLSVSWTIKADALDRATVKVPAGSAATPSTLVMPLQPSAGSKILLLVVTAAKYADTLSYKLDGTGYALTGPQVVSGPDLMNDLAATPSTVTFTNTGADAIVVDVFVLRVA
jgi:hypothetical protein